MTCQAISVGGGYWTICILDAGHPRSHLDRNPWQPITLKVRTPTMEDAARIAPRIVQPAVVRTPPGTFPARAPDYVDPIYQPAVLTTRPITSAPDQADVASLEAAARKYLADAEALKDADQELEDARANVEECQRRATAAAYNAQASAAVLTRYARP